MIIGIPKELKDKETRVGLIPHRLFPKGFGITGGNFKRGIYGCGRADA